MTHTVNGFPISSFLVSSFLLLGRVTCGLGEFMSIAGGRGEVFTCKPFQVKISQHVYTCLVSQQTKKQQCPTMLLL